MNETRSICTAFFAVIEYAAIFLCIFLVFGCNPNREFLSNDLQVAMEKRRVVQHQSSREEFQITMATPEPKLNKMYYWFRSGEIHNSLGDYSGQLINSDYIRYDKNEGLREKGLYKKGLRQGIWRTWHPNGKLQFFTNYQNGKKQGVFIEYDSTGWETLRGQYKNDLKHGKWQYLLESRNEFFRKGVDVTKDSVRLSTPIYKRIFIKKPDSLKRKKKKSVKKTKPPKQKNSKKATKTKIKNEAIKNGKQDSTTVKKAGFFKRLFNSSKKKITKSNDKG